MKSTKTSWFFIINPKSGNGSSSQRWSELEKLLQAENIPYQYSFTETIGHAIHLAKAAVEKGFRKIVAVGGDGTGHEVVNGILMQETCPSTEISFFLYPVGTGNDWVKMYGIPKKMKKWGQQQK